MQSGSETQAGQKRMLRHVSRHQEELYEKHTSISKYTQEGYRLRYKKKGNSHVLHYPSGSPLWVDLVSPDIDASVAFYCNLFGWEERRAEKISGYRWFSSNGKLVAGIRLLKEEPRSPRWISYISTNDTTRTISRAEAGGSPAFI